MIVLASQLNDVQDRWNKLKQIVIWFYVCRNSNMDERLLFCPKRDKN